MKHGFAWIIVFILSMSAGRSPAAPFVAPASTDKDVSAGNPSAGRQAITFATGGLPIILTAPHGGNDCVAGVPERKGAGVPKFTTKTDVNTDLLTERLASAVEEKLGRRPYVVVARFHRKYIDVNRRPEEAYESIEAKATYEAYHSAIASACKEISARWGAGLLLDIHGQAFEPDVVIRGTQDGKTVAHLLKQFGRDSVYGDISLVGELARQGFGVFPPVGSSEPENPNYSGGYTVGTHGSKSGGSMDAIQLELGADYRRSEVLTEVASKMAAAIGAFAKRYLPTEEPSTH